MADPTYTLTHAGSEIDTILSNSEEHFQDSAIHLSQTDRDKLDGKIPPGMIVLWSGSISNIPDGWALCDGQNGTPDLRDRFILGAGNNYLPNDIGGEATHVLTINEMPTHNHTGTTSEAGSHTHKIGTDKDTTYNTYGECWSVHNASTGAAYYNGSTNWSGNHMHSFTTENTGDSQAHNNMPPYYAVCYVRKL